MSTPAETLVNPYKRSNEGGVYSNLGEVALQAPEATAEADRSHEVYRLKRDPNTCIVTTESDVTLEDRREVTHPDDWEFIEEEAELAKGTKVVHINPTDTGGGVAMILPTETDTMNKLGLETTWIRMKAIENEERDGNPFEFTKLMHNILQGMTDKRITQSGKDLHWLWADTQNGPVISGLPEVQNADIIVIHDPQPAPLIARLREVNPRVKFIFRNHIDTSCRSASQREVNSYLLDECEVRGVDAIIAHPEEAFVHEDPELAAKTYFAPATFDQFDNLNRHLNEAEVEQGMQFINDEIAKKNQELAAAGRLQDIQPYLNMDPNKQRVTLIARFDPSKGMDKAMEMGVQTRQLMRQAGVAEKDLPEVVIVGNGSVDDPDGEPMFEEMLRQRREKYPEEADGIILMRLKHNYDAMNALMSRSSIIMQTSDAEGLETRVSDAIKHGKPVVISDRGAIKTQVIEGESGIVLDYDKPGHDLDRGARFMANLLMDQEAYNAMVETTKERAKTHNLREFTTSANVARMLRIYNNLLRRPGAKADKVWKMSELVNLN